MSDNDAAAESPLSPSVRRVSDWDADRLAGLAVEHGTPLYVQDLDRVRENSERLREAFPDADVRYAVKAHTGRAVLEAVREAGLDAECASAGEVDRALAAGFGGDRLHYTAVNPPARDLDYVVGVAEAEPDLTITVGAVDTLDRLAERGYDGRVCVRVNPASARATTRRSGPAARRSSGSHTTGPPRQRETRPSASTWSESTRTLAPGSTRTSSTATARW